MSTVDTTGFLFSGQDISCLCTCWSRDGTNGIQLSPMSSDPSYNFYFPSINTPPGETFSPNFTNMIQGQILTIINQSSSGFNSSIYIYTWSGGPQLQDGSTYINNGGNLEISTDNAVTFVLFGGTYWGVINKYSW